MRFCLNFALLIENGFYERRPTVGLLHRLRLFDMENVRKTVMM